jgi:membrane protease YdiL (CAAX protease family)
MSESILTAILASGTLASWGWFVARAISGKPVLPLRPARESAAWGPQHVVFAILSVLLFQVIAHTLFITLRPLPDDIAEFPLVEQAKLQLAISFASLLAAVFSLWFITRTTRHAIRDVGIGFRPLLTSIFFGVIGFFCFAAPSYILNMLLQSLDQRVHPVVELLLNSRNMPFFTYSCISVVLLSPLYEEIICRRILQGWLQAVFAGQSNGNNMLPTQRVLSSIQDEETADEFKLRVKDSLRQADILEDSSDPPPPRPTCWPSILLSSFFFAILHLGAGWASVISLFLFSIGLGLVYQRTGRLLSCIVMHMALNAFTMLMLYLEIVG